MHKLLFRWVGDAFRQHPLRVSALLVLSLLSSVADGLSISMLIPLMATLFSGTNLVGEDEGPVAVTLGQVADLAGPQYRLELIAGLIVGLVAIRVIIQFINGMNVAKLSSEISFKMRSKIFANLLGVDYQYICVTDNGKLINTLDGETWKVTDSIFSIFDLFSYACLIVALGSILVLISWQLTLLVVVLVAAVSLLRRITDKPTRLLGEKMVRASEDLSVRACELLWSMRMIRAFGRETSAQQGYEQASMRVVGLDLKNTKLHTATGGVQETLYALIVAILLIASVRMGLGQASLVAFLVLLHRVTPNIKAIDETRTHLIQATESVEAVSRLLDLDLWSAHASGTKRLEKLERSIDFENVTFSYAGKAFERRYALEDISFSIPIGKTTAFVGASGAGKSTVTNLLFRFHDPESGQIVIDGTPLNAIDLHWWRGQLAISGQDTDLISGTLRDNISYSRPEATEAEIVEAAQAADIHDFIAQLPLGYDTEVGERGLLLSGGQRQRIELARALLRKDAILILDEATNALDSMTEAEVFKAIESVSANRTVIIIAHRLSTTRMADQVIVLSHGKVAEQGPPAELYKSDGIFSKMVRLQELSYIVNDAEIAG
jgi:ATP-binding cassette, subfamily B, bacterial MsbA